AARLQHPNIIQVHEVGEHRGRPFLSLELVEGGSLAARLDGTPDDPDAAAQLVGVLARAVHYAHQRGVIHRDLKPSNILLGTEGTKASCASLSSLPSLPKITDFGLARRLDHDSGQTRSGAVLGTPSYMAPEQAAGQAHQAGPAADIYALGAILYEGL